MRKKPRLQRDRTGAKKPLLKHEVELGTSLSCTESLSSRKTSLQHETPGIVLPGSGAGRRKINDPARAAALHPTCRCK